jgi:ABC-type lipoprotein export system ATPase subunit
VTPAAVRPETVRRPATPIAACKGLTVAHGRGAARVVALDNVSVEIRAGELVAILGASGSGKTTLLHVLGGLIEPQSGEVTLRGEPLSSLDAAARGRARAGAIAYVFQGSNLLPHLSARENLDFAAVVAGERADLKAGPGPEQALALVGLEHKAQAMPAELSGGEQQRVAIARAIVQAPDLLLCDEPTGHLDSDTGKRVLDMLTVLRGELDLALAIATHDAAIAERADRVIRLVEGRVDSEVEL